KRVGRYSSLRDDTHCEPRLQRHTGLRINDVAGRTGRQKARRTLFRSRDALIREHNGGVDLARRISHVHQPSSLAWRRTHRVNRASSRVNERRVDAGRAQDTRGSVDRVSFADAAQVKSKTGGLEHNLIWCGEPDVLIEI